MTTEQVRQYADVGRLSTPDMDLGAILRWDVIPEFFGECGKADWRRKIFAVTVEPSKRSYDLPADFAVMEQVKFDGMEPLSYIGDDPTAVAECEDEQIVSDTPCAYYYGTSTSGRVSKALVLDVYPRDAYKARATYFATPYFANTSESLDLDTYMPTRFQWGLVEGLKARIYETRYGDLDRRTQDSRKSYAKWIEKAQGIDEEFAPRQYAKFLR